MDVEQQGPAQSGGIPTPQKSDDFPTEITPDLQKSMLFSLRSQRVR